MERWRQHARLAQHFLRCPCRFPSPPGRGVRGEGSSHGPCCGKALLLFMPLCTRQEVIDAEFAEGWVRLLDARHAAAAHPMNPATLALRDRLIRRYGVLFNGRRLVCRGCLGIRYGEVKGRRKSIVDGE